MQGYRAIHFHIKQKESRAEERPRDTKGSDPDLWKKRVEIQVSTLVMHAWSETEHDFAV